MHMLDRLSRSVLAAGAAGLLSLSAAQAQEELTLFAAASMTDAMTELSTAYTAAGNPPVKLAFASSSTLAKQIESGAPADLFISADQKWMDYLAERQLIVEETRVDLAGNALVVIVPADSPLAGQTLDLAALDWESLLADGRLAIGDPEHVPAGRYAKAALEYLGSWSLVEKHTVFAGDVRAALTFVETGEVAAGIVYATDAAISEAVSVIGTFPAGSHAPVIYPAAVLADHDTPAVRAFLDFLMGPEAAAVLHRYGFTTPGRES